MDRVNYFLCFVVVEEYNDPNVILFHIPNSPSRHGFLPLICKVLHCVGMTFLGPIFPVMLRVHFGVEPEPIFSGELKRACLYCTVDARNNDCSLS